MFKVSWKPGITWESTSKSRETIASKEINLKKDMPTLKRKRKLGQNSGEHQQIYIEKQHLERR